MTEFDPYKKWLGIRDVERPVNHYTLLGLSKFEQDQGLISDAASRRAAHIQDLSSGAEDIASLQQLLNEIAQAKICLTNTVTKAEYDAHFSVAGRFERTNRRAADRKRCSHAQPKHEWRSLKDGLRPRWSCRCIWNRRNHRVLRRFAFSQLVPAKKLRGRARRLAPTIRNQPPVTSTAIHPEVTIWMPTYRTLISCVRRHSAKRPNWMN